MESSIWSRNAKPDVCHFLVAVHFALGFVVARFFLDKFIFRRLAIWLSSNGYAPLKMNEATQAKIAKCSESMWKLAYYATVETFILKITYHEPWFTDTKQYFRGWPDQELKLSLSLFYMCQCGFYIYSIAALLTWETRRKDFAVMMSHHVITVILIGYSYITSVDTESGVSHSQISISLYDSSFFEITFSSPLSLCKRHPRRFAVLCHKKKVYALF
ncbi:hypothetical protein Gohar_000353 [Gossypium harknessii]|uniref:TLC domain-containing protein n=1 Tax=Gossypium harknessii TaxID=34285 RepID=A0A7J9I0D4_9ROSI|nr:hypothetical protein [Gossypium harknessii]